MPQDPLSRELFRGTDVRDIRRWLNSLHSEVIRVGKEIVRLKGLAPARGMTPPPTRAPIVKKPTAANQILVSVETAPSSGVYEWELRDAPATGTHVFMSVDGVADWVEVTEDFECPEPSS